MSSPFLLKIVSISDKKYKKQLLVSQKEVCTLQYFLKDLLKSEVMLINTNVGLDIYYRSETTYDEIIVSTFLLLVSTRGFKKGDFLIRSMNNELEVSQQTTLFFNRIISMPLLFKSYSRSLLCQIESNYDAHKALFNDLFFVWQRELLTPKREEFCLGKVLPFLMAVQEIYIKNHQSHPAFQKLLQEGTSRQHMN